MNDSAKKATVKVFVPCSCEACKADRPWYYCQNLDLIAEYDCVGFDEIESCPHPESVAWVEFWHPEPGNRFVYVHLGPEYQHHLENARQAIRRVKSIVNTP